MLPVNCATQRLSRQLSFIVAKCVSLRYLLLTRQVWPFNVMHGTVSLHGSRRRHPGEQPVGGVFIRERCTKTVHNRSIVVERNLFRKPEQDIKSFVDETRMTILLTKG